MSGEREEETCGESGHASFVDPGVDPGAGSGLRLRVRTQVLERRSDFHFLSPSLLSISKCLQEEAFFQEDVFTDQCEILSDSYFSAAESGTLTLYKTNEHLGSRATIFITNCLCFFLINGACASLREACTVVLHSGL